MRRIRRDGVSRRRRSRGYCLVEDGWHFPPKYTIGLAYEMATGRPLRSDEFLGGQQSNDFLRSPLRDPPPRAERLCRVPPRGATSSVPRLTAVSLSGSSKILRASMPCRARSCKSSSEGTSRFSDPIGSQDRATANSVEDCRLVQRFATSDPLSGSVRGEPGRGDSGRGVTMATLARLTANRPATARQRALRSAIRPSPS